MSEVLCSVDQALLQGDRGPVRGIKVTCSKCDHTGECFGTSYKSVRRAFMMLKEECPLGESNYYKADDNSDDPHENPAPERGAGGHGNPQGTGRPEGEEGRIGLPTGLPRRDKTG